MLYRLCGPKSKAFPDLDENLLGEETPRPLWALRSTSQSAGSGGAPKIGWAATTGQGSPACSRPSDPIEEAPHPANIVAASPVLLLEDAAEELVGGQELP